MLVNGEWVSMEPVPGVRPDDWLFELFGFGTLNINNKVQGCPVPGLFSALSVRVRGNFVRSFRFRVWISSFDFEFSISSFDFEFRFRVSISSFDFDFLISTFRFRFQGSITSFRKFSSPGQP